MLHDPLSASNLSDLYEVVNFSSVENILVAAEGTCGKRNIYSVVKRNGQLLPAFTFSLTKCPSTITCLILPDTEI